MDYETLFNGVQTEILDGISAIIPIALPVFGAILAITLGVKVFRRLAR